MSRPFHGGNLRAFTYNNPAVLDFSASINPFGMPVDVREALVMGVHKLVNYPDPDCLDLRRAIASNWQIEPETVLVGNGSTELIHLLALVLRPTRALIPIPTFAEYEDAVRLVGGGCLFVRPSADFSWPLETLLSGLDRVDLVFLCRPNSPTGYLMPEIEKMIQASESLRITMVVDETFLDFVPGGEKFSLVNRAATSSHLIVLRSFTKLYALPGLRLGYLVGGRRLVEKIARRQPPWMVNTLAQIAGLEALKQVSYRQEVISRLNREKERFRKKLSSMSSLYPFPSSANFILCRLQGIDSATLTDIMVQKGILIRDCAMYRGLNKRFIRLAVRTEEENDRLISAFKEVLYGV